jgi:hypothetical protein
MSSGHFKRATPLTDRTSVDSSPDRRIAGSPDRRIAGSPDETAMKFFPL